MHWWKPAQFGAYSVRLGSRSPEFKYLLNP